MDVKIQNYGKDKHGRQRYTVYLPERLITRIKQEIGSDDITGVILDLVDVRVCGREPPKHMGWGQRATSPKKDLFNEMNKGSE